MLPEASSTDVGYDVNLQIRADLRNWGYSEEIIEMCMALMHGRNMDISEAFDVIDIINAIQLPSDVRRMYWNILAQGEKDIVAALELAWEECNPDVKDAYPRDTIQIELV